MSWLTRQEKLVLATVMSLFLVGLAVKTYRGTQPPQSLVTDTQR
jgi:hypothetical protein